MNIIKGRNHLIFIAAFMTLSGTMPFIVIASEDADAPVKLAIETCLKKAREIRTYRYTYELYRSTEFLQRLRGAVVVPDRLHLTEAGSTSANAQGETIVIGNRQYYRNFSANSWHETQLYSNMHKMIHPLQEVLNILKDQRTADWTFDPSKNQLKLEYKRQLEFDVNSEIEIAIDPNKGYILEIKAIARGSYPPTLKVEEGWEQTEVWSFYDINDPGISIGIRPLTKK